MLSYVPVWALRSASLLAKCGLLGGLFFGLYLPARAEHAAARREFSAVTAGINRRATLLARILPDLQIKSDLLDELLEGEELRLPDVRRRDDVVVLIARTVAASGVNQESGVMWREHPLPLLHAVRWSRTLTLSGNYRGIAGLLRSLLELPCAVSIDDLEIVPLPRPSGDVDLRAQVTFSIYFRTDDTLFEGARQ